jgi:oligopeptide transport system substrate-binding protein
MISGAIISILVVVFGAVLARPHFPVHAAPHALAQNQTLTLPIITTTDPTLDSGAISNTLSYSVMSMVQVGLVGLNNGSLAPIPEAITRLPSIANGDVSPDGLTYTFHIKANLQFSNGDPITARTFAFSLERSMTWEVGLASQFAPLYLGELKGASAYIQANYANGTAVPPVPSISPTDPTSGIEGQGKAIYVQDDRTLVLTLQTAEAATLFFAQLSTSLAWAVDQNYTPADPFQPGFSPTWANANASAIPASGPFMIQSFTPSQGMVMVPNPHWFGPALTLTQVTIPFVSDGTTAFNGYQANQYDISPIDTGNIPAAKTLPSGQFHQAKSLTNEYVAMNWLDPFFSDVLVRQAFAETIDRAAIAQSIRGGSAIPSEHFVPQGMPGYDANLTGFGFNPVDARAKLQQAEKQDNVTVPSQIVFEYPADVTRNAMVSVMINDWNTYLGVNVIPNPKPFTQFLTDVQNSVGNDNVQIYTLGWAADYPDPQDFLTLLWGPNAAAHGLNGNNENPTDAWALMAQADADQNTSERYALYNQAEQLLVNEVAGTEIDQSLNSYVVKPWVAGYTLSAFGFVAPNAWANVQIQAH